MARHSETEEEVMVYRQEYGDYGMWVRPKAMFMETVEINGQPCHEDLVYWRHLGWEGRTDCPTVRTGV